VLFILARREQHAKLFTSAEWDLFLAGLAYGLATGMINI
jgi:hypothetical protein